MFEILTDAKPEWDSHFCSRCDRRWTLWQQSLIEQQEKEIEITKQAHMIDLNALNKAYAEIKRLRRFEQACKEIEEHAHCNHGQYCIVKNSDIDFMSETKKSQHALAFGAREGHRCCAEICRKARGSDDQAS
jgi:hypothetical protein